MADLNLIAEGVVRASHRVCCSLCPSASNAFASLVRVIPTQRVEAPRGADIIATDASSHGLRRLKQHEGANTYAACSPDGRLVSFFSTGKRGHGAGLFIMPIQRPWLRKKISNDVGDSLRWEPLPLVARSGK